MVSVFLCHLCSFLEAAEIAEIASDAEECIRGDIRKEVPQPIEIFFYCWKVVSGSELPEGKKPILILSERMDVWVIPKEGG